jgi:hypothetical protein
VGNPLAEFRVYDSENSKFFIGQCRPLKGYPSPTGRATRMFIVLDLERDGVICLKDAWRINHEGVEKEGESGYIWDLRRAGVPYIPDFICGDRTHELASSHVAERLRRHQHYRFVLREAARELTSFRSSLELVTAMGDALQGQFFPYEKRTILRRG